MKRKLKLVLPVILFIFMLSACSSKKVENPTEPATIPAIETKADSQESSEIKTEGQMENKISTIGIFKSEEIQEDVNGEYRLLTFTDEYKNDFIATISANTLMPEKMEVDKKYEVLHSEIMTMSLPGIYPEVYEIREAEK